MKPTVRALNDGRYMCMHRGHIKAIGWGHSIESAWANCERQYVRNKRKGRIDHINAACDSFYFESPFNDDITAIGKIKRWFK